MKRFISIILLCVIFLSTCISSSVIYAQDEIASEPQESEDAPIAEDYLSFKCVYNEENKNIVISGNMDHEDFSHYKGSKLLIYTVAPGKSAYDVATSGEIEPLAETDVSMEFGFTFKLQKFIDRYSRYAIFLKNEEGMLTLATAPQYPEVKSSVKNSRDNFKGIAVSSAAVASDAGAQTVVIPVFLDTLFTDNTSGYSYTVDGRQMFFDKGIVDELESKINSISSSLPKIYLQFLLRDNGQTGQKQGEKVKYRMPDMSSEETVLKIHSAVSFLSAKFEEEAGAGIDGIIMGKSWNNPTYYNYSIYESLDQYVEYCALYAVTVANAARAVKETIDVVIPFFADNFNKETEFSFDAFSRALFEYFDDSVAEGINCSVMMESDEMPFDITNSNIEEGVNINFDGYDTEIYPGRQRIFSEYLSALSKEYKSAPSSYMFSLNIHNDLYGNAFDTVYAYSYYALMSDAAVHTFIVDMSEMTYASDVTDIVKYIDTDKCAEKTSRLLSYFGVKQWKDIIGITQNPAKANKIIYASTALSSLPRTIKGQFNYFDFSDSMSSIDGWYNGYGCTNIRLDYAQASLRALKAELSMMAGERSEILYLYDVHDNMTYTPYLKFDLQINDSAEASLYSVDIFFENEGGRFESSYVVSGDEQAEIILDMSGYKYTADIANMKISVRSLYGDAENCTLWLYGIKGYSNEHNSAALAKLIQSERDKSDVSENKAEDTSLNEAVTIAIGVLLMAGALGLGLFIAFKKDTNDTSEDE